MKEELKKSIDDIKGEFQQSIGAIKTAMEKLLEVMIHNKIKKQIFKFSFCFIFRRKRKVHNLKNTICFI